ncbi:MAG: DUF4440 domain-containing protein [Chitinophagaceae bacterium]|nr:MAG: DUF4440 domain-containing protein [Chitinophagaceae bacterium]
MINFYKKMKSTINPKHLIVAVLAIIACNEPAVDNATVAADSKDTMSFSLPSAKSAIEAGNNKLMQSIRQGDSIGAASVYSQDALIMPSNSDAVPAKDAAAFWGSISRMGIKDAKVITEDVTGNAELLAETGRYEMYLADNKLADKGKYVVVWKMVDGNWKIYRDIFNTNLPAPAAKK